MNSNSNYLPQSSSSRPITADGTPDSFTRTLSTLDNCDVTDSTRDLPKSPLKSLSSSPSAAVPSRAGTLSWQQRPISRGSITSQSRPLSIVAAENNALKSPKAAPDPISIQDIEVSRIQIAQSLGAKDPSWFKQTADRGIRSAAFRRDQEESNLDAVPRKGSMPLPGLSMEYTTVPETEMSPPQESVQSSSRSRGESTRGDASSTQRFSSTTSLSSTNGIGSPLPTLESQRLKPPSSDTTSMQSSDPVNCRNMAMSPSQGRISPDRADRPTSPTKGLGGFVQSAMLKRSDSVNKRWSAQAGPGLSRGNSTASNRSGNEGSRNMMSGMNPPGEFISRKSREPSPVLQSWPASSHGSMTISQFPQDASTSASLDTMRSYKEASPAEEGFLKPSLPLHLRTKPNDEEHGKSKSQEQSPPATPSRSIDTKKWSPTKASWLESAINKPDSPKPKPPPQQPSWMSDISKAKQQRGSLDLGKDSSFKEVAHSGFMRSPAMALATKTPTTGFLPLGFDSGFAKIGKAEESDQLVKTKSLPPYATPENIQKQSYKASLAVDSAESLMSSTKSSPPVEKNIASPISTPSREKCDPGSPLLMNSQNSPLTAKPKPITPPKKDFRSTLKPRQASNGREQKAEPEFKHVFGKLKRTQTQNYVAPDELKNNILRGKAGLAVTAGPIKTERKDDLKESLVKQKEAMKAGNTPENKRSISAENETKDTDTPIPEAIARRIALTRSGSVTNISDAEDKTVKESLEALIRQKSLEEEAKPALPGKKPIVPKALQKEPASGGKLADRFNPALAGLLSRGPSPMSGGLNPTKTSDQPVKPNDLTVGKPCGSNEIAYTSPNLTHMTKARARGPKRKLPTASKHDLITLSGLLDTAASNESQFFNPGDNNSKMATSSTSSKSSEHSESRALANITNSSNKAAYQTSSPKLNSNRELELAITKSPLESPSQTNVLLPSILRGSSITKPKSPSSPKTGRLNPSPVNMLHQLSSKPELSAQLPRETEQTKESDLLSTSHQPSRHNEALVDKKSLASVRGAAARWATSSEQTPSQNQRAKSPIKLPTKRDEEEAMIQAGLNRSKTQELIGLGIQTAAVDEPLTSSLGRGLPSPPLKSPKSPPMPPRKRDSIAMRIVSNGNPTRPGAKATNSPIPRTSEAIHLFTEFFNEAPTSAIKVDIDAHSSLTSQRPSTNSGKTKTLRKQVWGITSDGRRMPIPAQQEHILFEDNMYLCTHVFGSSTGTRTAEVYLWCGDGVSSSAIENAQLFSKKVARENSCRLIILKQGKETSNFFQALGGIVITRRGSSAQAGLPSSASATYMLCGRLHMGQIAFDEVDFTSNSLCSGFPYIISARFGKLYLWKGKGSGADELGCARLIGMDLGLTGEIEEVDEGQESPTFWESFPGGRKGPVINSSHWHLKPSCEKYTTRLFSIEHETRPKSSTGFMWGRRGSTPSNENTTTANITEIAPFAQQDLSRNGIFVLDAFFEIYM